MNIYKNKGADNHLFCLSIIYTFYFLKNDTFQKIGLYFEPLYDLAVTISG